MEAEIDYGFLPDHFPVAEASEVYAGLVEQVAEAQEARNAAAPDSEDRPSMQILGASPPATVPAAASGTSAGAPATTRISPKTSAAENTPTWASGNALRMLHPASQPTSSPWGRRQEPVKLPATTGSVIELRIAIGRFAIGRFARTIVAGIVIGRATIARTVVARTVVARTVVAGIVIGRATIGRTIIARTIVAGIVIGRATIGRTIVAGTIVAGTVVAGIVIGRATIGRTIVTGIVIGRATIGRTIVTGIGVGAAAPLHAYVSQLEFGYVAFHVRSEPRGDFARVGHAVERGDRHGDDDDNHS